MVLVAIRSVLAVEHFTTAPRGRASSAESGAASVKAGDFGDRPIVDMHRHQAEKPLVCGILSLMQVQRRLASSQGESGEDR